MALGFFLGVLGRLLGFMVLNNPDTPTAQAAWRGISKGGDTR